MRMDGIYAIYFTGSWGSGHAVFVAKDGVVTGADAAGCTLDGTFHRSGDEMIHLDVALGIPAGGVLVTGFQNGREGDTQRITATIPADFGGGQPVAIDTPTGPVNVLFRRLRGV